MREPTLDELRGALAYFDFMLALAPGSKHPDTTLFIEQLEEWKTDVINRIAFWTPPGAPDEQQAGA